MSNSSSLSAAKRRRGGGPPIGPLPGAPPGTQGPPQMGGGGGGILPPGLPPNFRQMPPQLQQQILRQIQQRMMQAQQQHPQQHPQQHLQQHPQQHPVDAHQNIPIAISSNNMNEKMPSKIAGNGPYVVNSVLHNRAISEVDGIHIRDLPMSSAGLPCLPSGAALPPNILFKLHHDELLNQDATINEYSNLLQMLTNRVDKIERGGGGGGASTPSSSSNLVSQENTPTGMNSLAGNTDFIAKVLDNILTNTNLSDIINQIEPLQKENESLRALIHSQQVALNELSTLVMKVINGSLPMHNQHHQDQDHQHQHQHQHQTEDVTNNLNILNAKYEEDTQDEFCNYVNGAGGEMGEMGEGIYQQSQQEGQEEQGGQEEQDEGQEKQEGEDDGQEV